VFWIKILYRMYVGMYVFTYVCMYAMMNTCPKTFSGLHKIDHVPIYRSPGDRVRGAFVRRDLQPP
jgi:hypothetical protein